MGILNFIDLVFLGYFVVVDFVYLFLLILGTVKIFLRHKEVKVEDRIHILTSNSLPEICLLIPMYNEEQNIVATLQSILNLSYQSKQVIAINDGSIDQTLEVLKTTFKLLPIPKFYQEVIKTEEIRGIYRSQKYPQLIVLDKAHGKKFDTLNAGVNACSQPFFIATDADTLFENQMFEALVRPILASPDTIAMGATVRINNGCAFDFNRISTKHFPQGFLAGVQSVEYLRAFMYRQGWDFAGGNLLVAGAFSIFSKEVIVKAGGFFRSLSEDMEVILLLHRVMKENKQTYRMMHLADPIAWTACPMDFKTLGK